jgi:hypothetical protein
MYSFERIQYKNENESEREREERRGEKRRGGQCFDN